MLVSGTNKESKKEEEIFHNLICFCCFRLRSVNKRKLTEGAVLDVVFQESLKKTMEMMEKAQESRSKLQAFRSTTLKDSTLLVEEINNFKDDLDQPREEIAKLIQEKEEGDKLVGNSLKMEVLKDGASPLEFTAGRPRSGRSGKATLVGKFGSDDQVKGNNSFSFISFWENYYSSSISSFHLIFDLSLCVFSPY
ncbi:hypothetical protein QN277_024945 [Acacia crassicarpa]|uniref:RPW8 domain-containing protein n=1 Tax=Acacia crassicarpa TaxID=499986 RepID=A0AAE1K8H0_9FABA|nr:hypothetical protein QN277_024945 [Acacia crassicarpa]